MKKLVLTITSVLAIAGAAFAQGTVNWSTGFIPTAIRGQTNSTLYSPLFGGGATGGGATALAGGSAPAGTGFYYELLYNTSFTGSQVLGASAPSNSFATLFGGTWRDTGLTATNTATAGNLAGINPTTGAAVPWANGTTNNIVMVGWSANLGTSWAAVSNLLATSTYASVLSGAQGFFGVSSAGYINPGTGNPGVGPFSTAAQSYGLPISSGSTAGPLTMYLLPVAVPEPSTIALAGLGGLSLLLFRRRK